MLNRRQAHRFNKTNSQQSRRAAGRPSRRLAFEPLEQRQLLAATPISVHVAGSTGTEQFQLQIDGVAVATWTNTRVLTAARAFDAFNYTHPTDVTADRVRVALVNDGRTPAGADRNLFVDGVTIGGVKFESEATSVYSTGTWDAATNGRLPGFRQTEALHYNGYLQFGAAGSVIQIHAAGRTGEEQIQLQIGGQTVAMFDNAGGNVWTGQFVTFVYNAPIAVGLGQIRVVFSNDGFTSGGLDKYLRVDAVTLDGLRYQSEAPNVYSTGLWVAGVGRSPGYMETEYLHYSGYFEFDSKVAVGSVIEVRAAGRTGQEQMQLEIAGQVVATYSNVGGDYATAQFQTFVYRHPTAVNIDQIRINYTNDGFTTAGVDKNLRIDGVTLDGIVHQAEAADVFSTGTYIAGIGRAPGLWQSEYLHANGYLQFGSAALPGVLALGTTLISVDESAGTASIPVVRTGGSDGTVGLRYTTVNATAVAGTDFSANSGLIVFGPGETTKSIVVSITSDTVDEVDETFNLATDQPIGGARLNEPRTATITIVDNDGLPTLGYGDGLLGVYYDSLAFTGWAFNRVDPTIDFSWGAGSPAPSVRPDTFSIRWMGAIEPLYSETYTFRTTTDDGVRLYIDNQLVIDRWYDQGATDHYGSITLAAGERYDIRLEYYENTGDTAMRLYWSSPSQAMQIVPQSQLYSDPLAPEPLPGTFTGEAVVSGLAGPTAIDFDSSGRMFIAEQQGVVRVYQNGQLLSTPFLDIRSQVNHVQDRGLLGVAVHPNFPATPYVYVSYTYDPPETLTRTGNAGPDGGGNRVARVTRFTADAAFGYNRAVPGSEAVIVGTNSVWANISSPHLDSTDDMSLPPSGGMNGEMQDILIADSRSHTVGNIAFGPDGMLYVANGDGASYGRVDARASRVQSIDSLSGKLLRVDPLTGDGLADNPFYNGNPDANRSKVYNYGLRNPFRFAFHPVTGRPYIGDVGWSIWEEINTGVGQNFGWPWYEGGDGANQPTGGYGDLPAAQEFYASNNAAPSLWSRSHASGAIAIVAGDFYTGTVYDATYQNALFLSDFGDNQLRVLRLNDNGTLHSVLPLNLDVGSVVEMTMGRNGYMYYVDLYGGHVGRLLYSPPAAAALMAPTPTLGDFDGDGLATGRDLLSWQRNLGVTTDATLAMGDADGDGAVTAGDLATWKWGFRSESEPGDEALEPEVYWLALEQIDDAAEKAGFAMAETFASSSAPLSPASRWPPSPRASSSESPTLLETTPSDAAFEALAEENPFAWLVEL